MALQASAEAVGNSKRPFLKSAGGLLVAVGLFHLVFSLIGLWALFLGGGSDLTERAGIAGVLDSFPPGLWLKLGYGYFLLQILLGWLFGLSTMAAGRACAQARRRGFVLWMTVLNWFFFPAGTTVGLVVWTGLRRPSVADSFDS